MTTVISHLRNASEDAIVALVCICTVVSYATSLLWEHHVAPRLLFAREFALEREIAALDRTVNSSDDGAAAAAVDRIVRFSKVQRRLVLLRRELEQLRRARYAFMCDIRSMLFSPTTRRSTAAAGGSGSSGFDAVNLKARATRPLGTPEDGGAVPPPPVQPSSSAVEATAAAASATQAGPMRPAPTLSSASQQQPPPSSSPSAAAMYVRVNLAPALGNVLRWWVVAAAWLLWSDRPRAVVRFPDCAGSRFFGTLFVWLPNTISFCLFGTTSTMSDAVGAGGGILSPRETATVIASGSSDGDYVFSCSPFVWAVLCVCLARYACRVFS